MAESKAKIEFQTKKELFEAMVDNFVCSFCEVVPRNGPIYQSNELTPKNDDGDDESERPAKRPGLMVQKIACGECLPDDDKRFQRNFNLENMLYAYPITSCKFRKNDCKVIQDLKNIEYHEEDCEFRDILCPLDWCDELVPFSGALRKHFYECHGVDLDGSDDDLTINDKVFTLLKYGDAQDSENRRYLYFFHEIGKTFLIHLDYYVEDGEKIIKLFIRFYGSGFEAKNYNCLIQIGDSTHGRQMFKGPINSLDEDDSGGLVVSLDFAEKFMDDDGSLTVEIEIGNLKPQEEQTDYEEPMEAAATANDDKEKDTKN